MTDFRLHEPPENLLIFKTNVATEQDLQIVQQLLSDRQTIIDWSVDLEDIDKVMRIELVNKLYKKEIIDLLKQQFSCETLD